MDWAEHLPVGAVLKPSTSDTEDDGGRTIDSTIPFGQFGERSSALFGENLFGENTITESELIQKYIKTKDTCPYQKSLEEEKDAAEAETQPAYICVDSSIPPGQHTQEKRNSIMSERDQQPSEGSRRVKTKMGERDGDNDDDMGDDAIGDKVPSDGDDSDEEELAPAGPEAIAGLNLMDQIVQLMLRIEKARNYNAQRTI